jgi:hypothetical protein
MKFFTGLIIPVFLFAMLGLTAPEPAEASHHADHELTTSFSDSDKTCADKEHDCKRSPDGTCAYPDGACCKSAQIAKAEASSASCCDDCTCQDGCDCASGECADGCECSGCEACADGEGHCAEHAVHAKGLTSKRQLAQHSTPAKQAAVEVLVGAGAQAAARATASLPSN